MLADGRDEHVANESGNQETARLLAKVVEVIDPATGTVRVKPKVTDAGADLNRVRQQVIQLLHGYQGKEPATAESGRPERGVAVDILARIDAIESRLSAVEQRVGTGPDTGDLDQQIGQVRGER